MNKTLFTSESVSEGHPDKIADQISDAILDALLEKDKHAHVACETLVKTGMVLIAGEINTEAWADLEKITRKVISDIGYENSEMGFDAKACAVLNAIGKQSPDIARGITKQQKINQGAGDQGIMFGYACRETKSLMPAPIMYAHELMQRQASLRKSKVLPWLRPDAKAQVTFEYQDNLPVKVDTVVLSTQHDPDISTQQLTEAVIDEIIQPCFPAELLDEKTQFFVNPTGRFVIGGPMGDCGLTGRKIIVDTYGGSARHGGGAFSGKDPSKVDRSGAYMARYIAKNIVHAGIAEKIEIQIGYAIGVAKPVSVHVNTFGTSKFSDHEIIELIHRHFKLRPQEIITHLNLLRPIYRKTATYGHFGRQEPEFSWEQTDLAKKLN